MRYNRVCVIHNSQTLTERENKMKRINLRKENFNSTAKGYHIDAWQELILGEFNLTENVVEVELFCGPIRITETEQKDALT